MVAAQQATGRFSTFLVAAVAIIPAVNAGLAYFDECSGVGTLTTSGTGFIYSGVNSADNCASLCASVSTCTGATYEAGAYNFQCTAYSTPITGYGPPVGAGVVTAATYVKRPGTGQFVSDTYTTPPGCTAGTAIVTSGIGCAGTASPYTINQHGLPRETGTITAGYTSCVNGASGAYQCCQFQQGQQDPPTSPSFDDNTVCAVQYRANIDNCNLTGDNCACSSTDPTALGTCSSAIFGAIPSGQEGPTCQTGIVPVKKRARVF